MQEGYDKLAKKLRNSALGAVAAHLNEALPQGLNFKVPNPDDDEPEEEPDDDEGDEEEGEAAGEDDFGSLVFEDANAEHNLDCAVAAWRAAGVPGTFVGQHRSGCAFFGVEDDLASYIASHDLKDEDWQVIEDPEELLSMPYDLATMREVLKMLDTTEYSSAQEVYEKFHWGDASNVTVVKSVTGVTAPLVHLGVGRRIEYGAQKDGKFEEYFHEFGEESGKFPQVYAIMDPEQKNPVALLIHGGEMRVEPRGIVE